MKILFTVLIVACGLMNACVHACDDMKLVDQ